VRKVSWVQLVHKALTELRASPVVSASPDRLETEAVPATEVLLDPVDSQDPRDRKDSKEQLEALDSPAYRASEVTRVHLETRVLRVKLETSDHPDHVERLDLGEPEEEREELDLPDKQEPLAIRVHLGHQDRLDRRECKALLGGRDLWVSLVNRVHLDLVVIQGIVVTLGPLVTLDLLVALVLVDSQVSSVQFSYSIYVSRCSLIVKIMTAALTRSSYVETFQFSAGGQRTVRVSVMSS